MHRQPSFTLSKIKQELRTLGVPFIAEGSERGDQYSFKSIRNIENEGIYYLQGEVAAAGDIQGSIILCSEESSPCIDQQSNVALWVEHPQLVFYKLMEVLLDTSPPSCGIHPTAMITGDCQIADDAYVGPFCVLDNCVIGSQVVLYSHVIVMAGSTIEENVRIESHSTIGATGMAWIWDPVTRRRVVQPQTGYTRIGRDSLLGTDITVVRGSVNESTDIGEGCVIAHGSKIGHGSQIGRDSHFANNVAIAGNVSLGEQCFLGSGAVVRPQICLADRTTVAAGAVVVKNFNEERGLLLVGSPAKIMQPKSEKMSGVPKSMGN